MYQYEMYMSKIKTYIKSQEILARKSTYDRIELIFN